MAGTSKVIVASSIIRLCHSRWRRSASALPTNSTNVVVVPKDGQELQRVAPGRHMPCSGVADGHRYHLHRQQGRNQPVQILGPRQRRIVEEDPEIVGFGEPGEDHGRERGDCQGMECAR
jgi:hypothetical protein